MLLEIFYFFKEENDRPYLVWQWQLLVHVCRKWRQVVLASPFRLDLRIFCSPRTPVGKNLGIWPTLPLFIDFDYYINQRHGNNASCEDNIVTALEQVDRVCDVRLKVTASELEKISTAMQNPFPVLRSLYIRSSEHGSAPVLPADFLGGSAPCLQIIHLRRILFPALPTLLLSTSDLVTLNLLNIPASGYISPEAMVVGLAALPRLKSFQFYFQLASTRPDRIHPHPITRSLLPALTRFEFRGASEYLEDLISRIDAPQLKQIYIRYLNQLVDFQIPQLPMFIDRPVGPRLTQFRYAQVTFDSDQVTLHTYCHENDASLDELDVVTTVLCKRIDWQVSHIAQVLSHFSATLPNVVHLKLDAQLEEESQLEGTDDVEWLHLLQQVPTVQTLRVSRELAEHVALALEDNPWEAEAQMPPSLDLIHLVGQPASSIEKFVTARQLSGRPMTVVDTAVIDTEEDFYERVGYHVSE